MLSRAFQIAIGRSLIQRNKPLPLLQLALPTFSTDATKYSEKPESPDKTNSSQLRTRLNLRRQKLPKYPPIDFVTDLNEERFLPTNFKTVQHGNYQYRACLEDYVQVHSSGYQLPRPPGACGGYAVYYGKDHPLNESGPVDRRQGLNHSKMFGFLRALKSIPQGSFSKVSLNVDDMGLGRFVTFTLPIMSENAFRSAYSGKLNKDLETSMEINTLLRTRTDLKIRIQYTPNDIDFPPSYYADRIAKNAANDAQRRHGKQNIHFDDEI